MKFITVILTLILLNTEYAFSQKDTAFFTMDSVFCEGFSRNWSQKDGYDLYDKIDGLRSYSVTLIIGFSKVWNSASYLHGPDADTIRIRYNENLQQIDSFSYHLSRVADPVSSYSSTLITAKNIPVVEKDGYILFDLRGQELNSVGFKFSDVYTDASNESGRIKKVKSTDSFSVSSHITFRVKKQHLSSILATNPLQSGLLVYPNPCSGFFKIRLSEDNEPIIVYDILGRVVRSIPYDRSTEEEVDVSALPEGIYYLRSGETTQKLIIQQ